MEYFLHILILIVIYQILALSLDLLVGHCGLLSVAHAAFFGVGAYSSAILTTQFHLSAMLSLFIGIVIAGLLSIAIALPTLRLNEDYFVIGSFGFQIIINNIFNNWTSLTNGPMGISGIQTFQPKDILLNTKVLYLVLITIFLSVSLFISKQVTKSPFGRVMHALREDSILPTTQGKNLLATRLCVFILTAGIASVAGSLFAHYLTYIDPNSFTVMDSILIVTMVILGGAGTTWGPLIGAAILILLPEVIRFIGIPSEMAGNAKQIIYGLILLCCILYRSHGLVHKKYGRKGDIYL